MRRISFPGIMIGLLILATNILPCRQAQAYSANGSITVEVRHAGEAQKELQKAAAGLKIVFKSYSDYKNSSTGKRAISANCLVDKAQAVAFINQIAALGSVQSQSYYENQEDQDLPSKEKKLKVFQKYLTRALTSADPDPDVVALISQQVQSLQCEVNRIKTEGQGTDANVSIQIQEKGYNQQPFDPMSQKAFAKMLALLVALLLLFLGGLLGWLLAKRKFKKLK
jgi:hypothetical protein